MEFKLFKKSYANLECNQILQVCTRLLLSIKALLSVLDKLSCVRDFNIFYAISLLLLSKQTYKNVCHALILNFQKTVKRKMLDLICLRKIVNFQNVKYFLLIGIGNRFNLRDDKVYQS